MTSREAFEVWCGTGFRDVNCDDTGEYLDGVTFDLWCAWQAAVRYMSHNGWVRHAPECASVLQPAVHTPGLRRAADPCDCGINDFVEVLK